MKKNIVITLAAIAAFFLLSVSCKKDGTPAKPQVTLTEVGHDNSRTAMRGDDLHLEADILAEGLIQRIDVVLHREEGGLDLVQAYTDGKYIGVKNTEFHEHIDIPADAPLGTYHLHFTVTDRQGQTTTAETQIEIEEFDENHHHDE